MRLSKETHLVISFLLASGVGDGKQFLKMMVNALTSSFTIMMNNGRVSLWGNTQLVPSIQGEDPMDVQQKFQDVFWLACCIVCCWYMLE